MYKPAAVFALFSILLFPLARVHAGPLRIVLLADTTIQGDTILLSHLLPPAAPLDIRHRAEKVVLGAAPEIGNFRSLSREILEASLQEADLRLESFAIPDTAVVHREGRRIAKEDVLRVLQSFLAARPDASPVSITSDQISMEASISVPEGDARLSVTEFAFDNLLGCARFRISSHANAKAPPFYAWLSMPRPLHPAESGRSHTPHDTARAPTAPAAVESRRMATLYLHSANSSTLLRVRPLQRGSLGETIRVRVPTNGRTLLASVTGPDLLDAVF